MISAIYSVIYLFIGTLIISIICIIHNSIKLDQSTDFNEVKL